MRGGERWGGSGGVFGTRPLVSPGRLVQAVASQGSVLAPGHPCGPGAFVPTALGIVPPGVSVWAPLRPPCPLRTAWAVGSSRGGQSPATQHQPAACLPLLGPQFPACRKRVLSEGSPLLPRPDPARPSSPLPREALCLLCVWVRVSPVLHTLLALGTCSAIYLVGPSLGFLTCKVGRVIAPAQRLALPPSLLITCLPRPHPLYFQ